MSFLARSAHVETVGLLLCLLGVATIALLLAGLPLPVLVPALGLHSFTVAAFLVGVGALIWRRLKL